LREKNYSKYRCTIEKANSLVNRLLSDAAAAAAATIATAAAAAAAAGTNSQKSARY